MWIDGEHGTYWCEWGYSGWSFVEVHVRRKRKRFYGLMKGVVLWRKADRQCPEKMHPKELEAWFLAAVHEYEDYQLAWGQTP